jgi:hypothetical protein
VFISFLEISIINFATAQVVILQAVEMDYLRRNARKSKLETVPDVEIRRIMQAEGTVLDRIEAKIVRACDENARREMASLNSLMDPTGK